METSPMQPATAVAVTQAVPHPVLQAAAAVQAVQTGQLALPALAAVQAVQTSLVLPATSEPHAIDLSLDLQLAEEGAQALPPMKERQKHKISLPALDTERQHTLIPPMTRLVPTTLQQQQEQQQPASQQVQTAVQQQQQQQEVWAHRKDLMALAAVPAPTLMTKQGLVDSLKAAITLDSGSVASQASAAGRRILWRGCCVAVAAACRWKGQDTAACS
jgi:hypothetical protein